MTVVGAESTVTVEAERKVVLMCCCGDIRFLMLSPNVAFSKGLADNVAFFNYG